MKGIIFSFFSKGFKRKELTVQDIKSQYPHIYKEIFDKGALYVHQIGVCADDLKSYPNGEGLAIKVKNGEMTFEEASIEALKYLRNDDQKDKPKTQDDDQKNESKMTIGFKY